MILQPPSQTDLINQLNQRVTALEGAAYDETSTVDMFKLFNDSAKCTDSFTISTHTYHLCGPGTICSTSLIV